MWVLSHITTGTRFYLLTNSKRYSVGRTKQNELLLPDESVSREHAVIYRSSSGVRVEDTGSKYGVFVNSGIDTNKPIEPKTPVELQTGHIVRFGRLGNTFRLENIPFTVCTSAMLQPDQDKLKKLLKLVDGTLQSVWSTECTHLVMTNVTVTVKVLQSLAYGIPIVSPQYFETLIQCVIDQSQDLPDINQFIPEITEPYIIKEPGMMEVHLERQRLFQNKTFVFMVKRHMVKFESIIKLAGGKCINIEDGIRMQLLLKTEYIPVQYTPTANTQCSADIEEIEKYIKNERRLINESEIGLAIIHRATDRFCNPDRKMVSDFKPTEMDTNNILKKILTEETPHTTSAEKSTQNSVVIPESELTGTEPNNNLRDVEAIDLNKPSTSKVSTEMRASSRRSTRSSTKGADVAIFVPQKPPSNKALTPKKNQKRKNVNEGDQQQTVASIESEQSMPQKKQKTQDSVENQGENSSLFVEPLPPQSQSQSHVLNFSGFISTQNRKRKATQDQSHWAKQANMSERSEAFTRKRAISMLTADSDEEEDDDRGNAFIFERKTKRTKVTSAGTTLRRVVVQRNILDDSDNDHEDGCGFNFSKKPLPKSQVKQKFTQEKTNEKDTVDGTAVAASQNSYKLPFRPPLNRSFNRTLKPVDITFAPPKCDTHWITLKLKNELNLDGINQKDLTPISDSVQIKAEKLEEWELTDEEQKKQWIKSLAKVFKVRKVEVNIAHRSKADETDGSVPKSENTSLNKSKNFKKFVKRNNFIPRTVVIKTNTVPVVLSKFARV